MRNGQNNKRMRNRNNNNNNNNNNRRRQNPMTRVFESNGPDIKICGTASHVAEKYVQLARDARSSGDPVAAENYYQHAEHYFRLIAAAQEQFRQNQPQPRTENEMPAEDGDDEGESFSHFGAEPGFVPIQPQPFVPREQQREQPRDAQPSYQPREQPYRQPRENNHQPRDNHQPREYDQREHRRQRRYQPRALAVRGDGAIDLLGGLDDVDPGEGQRQRRSHPFPRHRRAQEPAAADRRHEQRLAPSSRSKPGLPQQLGDLGTR